MKEKKKPERMKWAKNFNMSDGTIEILQDKEVLAYFDDESIASEVMVDRLIEVHNKESD